MARWSTNSSRKLALRSPRSFLHFNSRRARFRLTFQFQMLLHLSGLNGDGVITCVRAARRA